MGHGCDSPGVGPPSTRPSNAKLWTARVVGGLVTLFLLVDAVGKILRFVVFGVLVWGCLFLRDDRVRDLLPLVAPRRSA